MPRPPQESPCKVCLQPAFAEHFAVWTCRACAAFFRRRVKEQHKLKTSCELSCEKEQNLRKHCATCRFKNCLDSGMKPPISNDMKISNLQSVFVPGPIFESLHRGYRDLENARKLAFGIQDDKIAQPSTYTVQNTVVAVDFRLTMEHFLSGSEVFEGLKSSHKSKLLSQFIAPLHIVDGTYKSAVPSHFYLANGDYIDFEGLPKFYKDLFDQQHQQAFRIYQPYWNLQNLIMRSYLDEVNLDLSEFLFLIALMLWDIDFHDCDEDLILICIREKKRVISELCDYERHREASGGLEDRSMRVGRIVRILHGVQKTLNMLYECSEVARFYQLDSMHNSIMNSLKGPLTLIE